MLLVTGAAGHVGAAIARQAAQRGARVLATYRPGQGHAPPTAEAGSGITWEPCELTDPAAVQGLADLYQIDACIHAAAVSNEAYAKGDPLGAIASNIGATANLLDTARLAKWRRFVLVSTGSVFQRPHDIAVPILEDATPTPINIYGTTKCAAEMLTAMYRSQYAVSAATVRISWVFGPPIVSVDPPRGPVPSFLVRTLRGEKIRETGGDFAASFTYVADAAAGLIAAALAPELRHPVYHLGHGVNFGAAEVAAAVRAAIPSADIELGGGTEPWTRYTTLRAPLAGNRLSDDTGFVVAHSLEAGVRAYAEWLQAHPERWRAA